MDVYAQIVEKIIEGQEAIIGPVAIEQAQQIENLEVNWAERTVIVSGDGVKVIEDLVQNYRELFGQISVEVSKESAAGVLKMLPNEKLPLIFQHK
jgi:hypothetical protein